MSATSITQAINTLQSNILQHVHHRALLQNVGQPTLQQEQLFFIQLPFLNGASMDDEQMKSAVAVGVVHASLLEHENVKETESTSKQQQLTVLSGDYYSGRYYQILAHTGNIALIQKLSQGIVERCEHQVRIYEQSHTLEDWIDSLTVIESKLIEQFYVVYNFTTYIELMKQSLTVIRLQKELNTLQQGQSGFLYKAFLLDGQAFSRDALVETLQQQIQQRKEQLQELLNKTKIDEELKLTIAQLIAI